MTTAEPPITATGTDLVVGLPAAVATVLERGVSPVHVSADTLPAHEHVDEDLLAQLVGYLNDALSPATRRAYTADWRTFTGWCESEGFTALPATPLTVAVYLAVAANTKQPPEPGEHPDADKAGRPWRYAVSTLERHAAAIVAVHNAHHAPSPRDALVRQTLASIRRRRKTPPVRRRPAEIGEVRKMLAHRADPGWPGGPARRRDRCLLLFGFAGALRRSEAAAIDLADLEFSDEAGLHVRLPSSKTDQEGLGDVIALPFGSDPLTCPVCAYVAWLEVLEHHDAGGSQAVRQLLERAAGAEIAAEAKHGDHDRAHDRDGVRSGPLFRPITRHGHLTATAMSGDAVHEIVRRYAARAGLPPHRFGGHSLRAGFATTAARAGAPNREIMKQGRWKSHATVDNYVRLADPFAGNAVTKLGL